MAVATDHQPPTSSSSRADRPPRDGSADGFANIVESFALSNFEPFWRLVMAIGPLHRWASRRVIDRAAKRTRTRPSPFGSRPIGGDPAKAMAGYVSWDLLTDQTWFSRHLAPRTMPVQPPIEKIEPLWTVPPGGPALSDKSSVLFMSFAQWFTDGFLMTDEHDRRRTHTSHHIDFNPLYGLSRAETEALRRKSEAAGERGRLKSERANGEEYAPRYFDGAGSVKAEFAALRAPLRLQHYLSGLATDAERARVKAGIFAFGGERANSTPYTAALTTLFLREHNRIAAVVERENSGFDDERVFQTARNCTSAILLKLVVEDYVNHIAPYHLKLIADPLVAWNAPWNKPNWIPIEFNVLYRWHSMCPEQYAITSPPTRGRELLFANPLLTAIGLGETLDRASRQPAWRVGLFNTADFLIPVEKASLTQARENMIASYNDYREAYGYPRAKTFAQITGDPQRQQALKDLYGTPENLEFFVGIFAEDVKPHSALPPLIGRMVALDAFTLALTSPLLSEHVWADDATFTPAGKAIIAATDSLQAVLDRNTPRSTGHRATMSYN